jgi:5-methylthioadenosine/S-adenosylhomocysteine deaminase
MGERTLVEGDALITLGDPAVSGPGAAVVVDGHIDWIGSRDEARRRGPFTRRLGGPGRIVMPGLANAHFHSDFELPSAWAQYPIERSGPQAARFDGSEELAYLVALSRLIPLARSGQTTILDFVYGRDGLELLGYDALRRAYADLGLRASFGLAMRDESLLAHGLDGVPPGVPAGSMSPGYGVTPDAQFEALEALTDLAAGDPRLRAMPAPDWTPACSDALLDRCVRVSDELGSGMTMHVLETRRELEYGLRRGGSVMSHLRDAGVLRTGTSCAHFVWATDEDVAILAETGATAIFNPGSNLRLGSGVARVRAVMASGAAFAFGTDATSFSGREDLFEEIRLAEHLQRVTGDLEGGRLSSERLIDGACVAGAAVAGFGALGRLEPGAPADLLVIDATAQLAAVSEDDTDLLDAIIDTTSRDDVEAVLVDGRPIVVERRVVTVDESEIARTLEGAGAHVRRLAPRVSQALDRAILAHYRSWPDTILEPGVVMNARAARWA